MVSNSNERPKCWVCKDSGLLTFEKKINGLHYEFAARCTCIAGQRMSNRIKNIDNSLAEVFAMENYMSFNGNLE